MEVNAIWPMTTTLNCKGYMPDYKFGAQSVKSTDNFRVIFFFLILWKSRKSKLFQCWLWYRFYDILREWFWQFCPRPNGRLNAFLSSGRIGTIDPT